MIPFAFCNFFCDPWMRIDLRDKNYPYSLLSFTDVASPGAHLLQQELLDDIGAAGLQRSYEAHAHILAFSSFAFLCRDFQHFCISSWIRGCSALPGFWAVFSELFRAL